MRVECCDSSCLVGDDLEWLVDLVEAGSNVGGGLGEGGSIEAVQVGRGGAEYHLGFAGSNVSEVYAHSLSGEGEGAFAMREVAAPHDPVDPDLFAQGDFRRC